MREAINSGYYIYMYYKDNYINPKNYSDPIKQRYGSIYSMIEYDLYKEIEVFFKAIFLSTDTGLITEDYKVDKTFQLSYKTIDFSFNTEGVGGLIATYWIYFNRDVDYYTRRYLKLQELGASIGGIFKFLNLCCFIINYLFNDFDMNIHIINLLYNFDESILKTKEKIDIKEFYEKHEKLTKLKEMKVKSNSLNIKQTENENIESIHKLNNNYIYNSQFNKLNDTHDK